MDNRIRLQKYLSMAGVASRRKAEDMILAGKVRVNGQAVTEPGIKVIPGKDEVEVNGKAVKISCNMVYIMLHKPVGYVTTVSDQFGRPTVVDLVRDVGERVYPVGRLDYDTSGLLLLTNDGDLTHRITHPSHEIEKKYIAVVEGKPDEKDMRRLKTGIEINNRMTSPARARILRSDGKTSTVEIKIHEGRNRQVRKMFDMIGHRVLELKRVAIGRLKLGDLPEGKWRYLSAQQVKKLSE